MTATQQLAQFAAELTYEQIPAPVAQLAKHLTLDTLGTALAATTLGTGCAEMLAVMAALGGPPESTLLGTNHRISAVNAACAYGALAHALNYDAYGPTTGHTGVVCFAAPFAMAEARAPVSGKRFLTAAIVAGELTARVTRAAETSGVRVSERVLGGQYFGYLGAAAGAGSIIGLDAARMHSALGLALMQTAGSRQVVIGGDPPAKAIYGAFPNQAGVMAALLAEAGLDARIAALEGTAGIFGPATDGRFDAAALLDGLGRDFIVRDVQFKPWPTSGHIAPFIEAAIELASAHNLDAGEIAAVELTGSSHIRDWFEPIAERRRPSNVASAANSTMFAVANAFIHRDVSLTAFSASGLRDEHVLGLADRITYQLHDEVSGGIIAVQMRDGRAFRLHVQTPLGDATRPMTRERFEAKFTDCYNNASPQPARGAAEIIALVDHLETLPDVSALVAPRGREDAR